MTTIQSKWKVLLDRETYFDGAEDVFTRALREGSREELLDFLGALYEEFVGPDEVGGGDRGTLTRMHRLRDQIRPTESELGSCGIDSKALAAYFAHE